MTNFTPGPWKVEMTTTENNEPFGYVMADDGIVTMLTLQPQRVIANTHLIAAAPDMYAVLKSMESVDDDPMANGDPRRVALLAAIAKAEGK